jgi:hypothetical protein
MDNLGYTSSTEFFCDQFIIAHELTINPHTAIPDYRFWDSRAQGYCDVLFGDMVRDWEGGAPWFPGEIDGNMGMGE